MNLLLATIITDSLGILQAAGVEDGRAYHTWSEDGGVTWASPRQITLDECDHEQPGLAEMDDGSLRAAVTQADAVRIYGDGATGETWEVVGVLI